MSVRIDHVALPARGADRFAAVVAGLRERGAPFGDDPAAPDNGRTDDDLGEAGRVHFADPDGHLIEVVSG